MSRVLGRCSAALVTAALLSAAPAAGGAEPPPAPGDAAAGLALFTGARRMQNGGAACGACHAIGGHGPALAGSLGPELSRSFEGLPPDAVDGMLQDLPFPTMTPIYAGRALTAQERADLAAFLVGATGAAPPRGGRVAGWVGAILAGFVVVLALGARRRKGSTRSRLRPRSPAPERPSIVGNRNASPARAGATRAAASGGGTR